MSITNDKIDYGIALIANRIDQAIKNQGWSYKTAEIKTGIPSATLQRYATGKTKKVPLSCIEIIAKATGTTATYLMGWDDSDDLSTKQKPTKGVRIPVYGNVAAGIPIEAITDIEDYEEISEDLARTGEFAALKIHGDSMEPKMSEGDVVIVRIQPTIENGEIAIVMVNGDEATCKKVKKTEEGIMLISTNPTYEPMFYTNREIEELPIRIFGKVVELRAKF